MGPGTKHDLLEKRNEKGRKIGINKADVAG
jgi:hypothetical protein